MQMRSGATAEDTGGNECGRRNFEWVKWYRLRGSYESKRRASAELTEKRIRLRFVKGD